MKLRIVLCCVIGVVAAASTPSSTEAPSTQHYDTIVIGLGSAGIMAASTLARTGKRVLGLEAQDRVGGRVNTVAFGDGVVEMGAEWYHETNSSRIDKVASDNNITIRMDLEYMEVFSSDGEWPDKYLINQYMAYYMRYLANPTAEPPPNAMTRALLDLMKKYPHTLLKDPAFVSELTVLLRYRGFGEVSVASWHRNGYKTLFDILLNKHDNGTGLPNLDMKLSTEVASISAPQRPGDNVVVTCKDGTVYEADNAIVTVSLGVLKATHQTLFSRPLPDQKLTAIDKISVGVVDKIALAFDQPWYPRNYSVAVFLWTEEDKKNVRQADHWITKITGASRSLGSSNTLTLWTSGDAAKEMEALPDDEVKTKSVEILQRFVGNKLNVTVPQPVGMLRSSWYVNPFTRGSYSFDSAPPQYPEARDWLRAPLRDSNGVERVLFAGEATHAERYGTVHGATETGYIEAMKLLNKTV